MLRPIAVQHNLRVQKTKPEVMPGNYWMKINAFCVCYIFFSRIACFAFVIVAIRHLFPPFRSSCFLTSGRALDAHKKLGYRAVCFYFTSKRTSYDATVREIHLYLLISSALKTHEWQESSVELPTRLKTREMATFRLVCLSLTRKLCTRIFRKWPSPKRMVSSCSWNILLHADFCTFMK